jgi:hypothetical protein
MVEREFRPPYDGEESDGRTVWQKTTRFVLVSVTQEANLEVGAAAFDGGTPYLAVLPSGAARSVSVRQKTVTFWA